MKPTEEIIKKCFEKAKFTGDRAKYLFKLLSDEIDILFHKKKKKIEEDAIIDLLLEGYSFTFDDNIIEHKDNSIEYNGEKEFVVRHSHKPAKGFATIKGALNYVENNR